MTATLLALIFGLGADLDAQASPKYRVREAARLRVAAHPGLYAPVALLRMKHPDPAVRSAGFGPREVYRRHWMDLSLEMPGGKYPWLDMLTPHRFAATEGQEPPAFWGLDRGPGTGDEIVQHFLYLAPDLPERSPPEWSRYRHATGAYVRELLRAGVDREAVLVMLRRMAELESLYAAKVYPK